MTRLSKHARRNKVLSPSLFLSILGGFFIFSNFVVWSSVSHGFKLGHDLGKFSASSERAYPEHGRIQFPPSEGTYSTLSNEYANLSGWSMIFMALCLLIVFIDVGKFLPAFTFANILAMLLICTRLIWLLSLKDPASNESLDSLFNELALRSVFYDRLAIAVASVVILLQIVVSSSVLFERERLRD